METPPEANQAATEDDASNAGEAAGMASVASTLHRCKGACCNFPELVAKRAHLTASYTATFALPLSDEGEDDFVYVFGFGDHPPSSVRRHQ